jgi:hypothetical protein
VPNVCPDDETASRQGIPTYNTNNNPNTSKRNTNTPTPPIVVGNGVVGDVLMIVGVVVGVVYLYICAVMKACMSALWLSMTLGDLHRQPLSDFGRLHFRNVPEHFGPASCLPFHTISKVVMVLPW